MFYASSLSSSVISILEPMRMFVVFEGLDSKVIAKFDSSFLCDSFQVHYYRTDNFSQGQCKGGFLNSFNQVLFFQSHARVPYMYTIFQNRPNLLNVNLQKVLMVRSCFLKETGHKKNLIKNEYFLLETADSNTFF